ncbi:NAD-dependent dehydratase [Rhizobium leguminosarum]|uniref:NAD-dependent dehydratase n=1 Tax=Rhizobium leguminosarum TaxID=384 RepID=UPI00143FADCF|nr:NAD-dependent dehydratase [Rhizobium leguminosarum]NKL21252.1 NAD-dependent dehydratase [Rhizobium leguminosarum bv. viciae]NKL56759.1 NAD-dependent dehydratase [Rhizobium leguminosarum bv. viciae]
MKLLLVGSTGLVGRHALDLALQDRRVDRVIAPTRRTIREHPKLLSPLVDFDCLPAKAPWWNVDAVVCTLGTTMRSAGSGDAFRKVDYGYPLEVGRLARTHGANTYVLNSAIGADVGSRFFYNRTKGELERDLANLGWQSFTAVRPGLIGGDRDEYRLAERAALLVVRTLGSAIPRRWRINTAERIAHALLESAINPVPGIHSIEATELV